MLSKKPNVNKVNIFVDRGEGVYVKEIVVREGKREYMGI